MSARRFLEVDDLTPAEFATVLDVAEKGKADPTSIPALLAGKGVVMLFEKPSTRTRASTEMAVVGLGGHPIYVRPEEVGLGARESVADVARTFAGFCSVIAARVFDHATLEEMAAVVDVPIVNLLSDRAHPTQAVADFLTLRELLGTLEGRRLAYVGDGNNVTASLAYAAALSGVELAVASPPGYELDDLTVERVRNLGGIIELGNDPVRRGGGGRRGLHRRLDVDGPGGRARLPAWPRSPVTPSTTRSSVLRAPTRGSCTASPRTAARRSRHRSSTARAARSGRRPPTACTRPAPCSPIWSGGHSDGDAVEAWPDGRDAGTESTNLMATLGKPQRQHRIARLLEEQAISSQAQLVEMLAADGVIATQATVSRDLEELGAVKVRIPGGAMAYAIPEHAKERTAPDDHLRRVMGEFVVEVAHSANLVVLRTPPGSAHVVASALDRSGLPDVLGTVAGRRHDHPGVFRSHRRRSRRRRPGRPRGTLTRSREAVR